MKTPDILRAILDSTDHKLRRYYSAAPPLWSRTLFKDNYILDRSIDSSDDLGWADISILSTPSTTSTN
jgi:hypothetical protein